MPKVEPRYEKEPIARMMQRLEQMLKEDMRAALLKRKRYYVNTADTVQNRPTN